MIRYTQSFKDDVALPWGVKDPTAHGSQFRYTEDAKKHVRDAPANVSSAILKSEWNQHFSGPPPSEPTIDTWRRKRRLPQTLLYQQSFKDGVALPWGVENPDVSPQGLRYTKAAKKHVCDAPANVSAAILRTQWNQQHFSGPPPSEPAIDTWRWKRRLAQTFLYPQSFKDGVALPWGVENPDVSPQGLRYTEDAKKHVRDAPANVPAAILKREWNQHFSGPPPDEKGIRVWRKPQQPQAFLYPQSFKDGVALPWGVENPDVKAQGLRYTEDAKKHVCNAPANVSSAILKSEWNQHFSGPSPKETVIDYLRQKYQSRPESPGLTYTGTGIAAASGAPPSPEPTPDVLVAAQFHRQLNPGLNVQGNAYLAFAQPGSSMGHRTVGYHGQGSSGYESSVTPPPAAESADVAFARHLQEQEWYPVETSAMGFPPGSSPQILSDARSSHPQPAAYAAHNWTFDPAGFFTDSLGAQVHPEEVCQHVYGVGSYHGIVVKPRQGGEFSLTDGDWLNLQVSQSMISAAQRARSSHAQQSARSGSFQGMSTVGDPPPSGAASGSFMSQPPFSSSATKRSGDDAGLDGPPPSARSNPASQSDVGSLGFSELWTSKPQLAASGDADHLADHGSAIQEREQHLRELEILRDTAPDTPTYKNTFNALKELLSDPTSNWVILEALDRDVRLPANHSLLSIWQKLQETKVQLYPRAKKNVELTGNDSGHRLVELKQGNSYERNRLPIVLNQLSQDDKFFLDTVNVSSLPTDPASGMKWVPGSSNVKTKRITINKDFLRTFRATPSSRTLAPPTSRVFSTIHWQAQLTAAPSRPQSAVPPRQGTGVVSQRSQTPGPSRRALPHFPSDLTQSTPDGSSFPPYGGTAPPPSSYLSPISSSTAAAPLQGNEASSSGGYGAQPWVPSVTPGSGVGVPAPRSTQVGQGDGPYADQRAQAGNQPPVTYFPSAPRSGWRPARPPESAAPSRPQSTMPLREGSLGAPQPSYTSGYYDLLLPWAGPGGGDAGPGHLFVESGRGYLKPSVPFLEQEMPEGYVNVFLQADQYGILPALNGVAALPIQRVRGKQAVIHPKFLNEIEIAKKTRETAAFSQGAFVSSSSSPRASGQNPRNMTTAGYRPKTPAPGQGGRGR